MAAGVNDSPLGRDSDWPQRVDAGVLFAIDRAAQREVLGLARGAALPFHGVDQWCAWELSWLDAGGVPQVAVARLAVPADSPAMVESKSLKLYLGGYAHESFAEPNAVAARIAADLGACCGAPVAVALEVGAALDALPRRALAGRCIDEAATSLPQRETPDAGLLRAATSGEVEETLCSRVFRSTCPVTAQPDWAEIEITYRGPVIDTAALLAYLVSFRHHRGFHEQCVERILLDLQQQCRPRALSVGARFTRRGGIDISPWRSTDPAAPPPPHVATPRQ